MKEAVSKADFVQESVPERLLLKAKVFAQMDEVAPLDSILRFERIRHHHGYHSVEL